MLISPLPAAHTIAATPTAAVLGSIAASAVVPSLTGLALLLFATAAVAWAAHPRVPLVRLFALLMLSCAVGVIADPLRPRFSLWGFAIAAAADGLAATLFVRFCLAYPDPYAAVRMPESRWLRPLYRYGPLVPLATCLAAIILFCFGGAFSFAGVVTHAVGLTFGMPLGLALLLRTALRSNAVDRPRILVVWLGAALACGPVLVLAVLPGILLHQPIIPLVQTQYWLIALPLGAAFAAVRWRSVSLLALVDRVSVYVVLGLLLLCCYAAFVFAVTQLEGIPASSVTSLFPVALAIIAAATFAPLRARVQRFIDTVLYRDYYDLGPTLERFSHALATVRDQGAVASTLVDDLCDTLNLSGAALVQLPGGFDPAVLRLIEPSDLIASRQYADDAVRAGLVAQLAALDPSALNVSHRQPVVRDPFPGCAALVIIGPGGGEDVSALLLVGRKRGSSGLRYEDRTLLGTVAHQAATALENAALIGGLRTTLSQLRRSTEQLEAARAEKQLLLRQLVDAEERQRAALARDIHDDALQDLMYVIRHSRYSATLASTLSLDEHALAPAIHRLRDELDQVAEAAVISERKLRDLCAGLYPALLESLGLRYAIGALVEDVTTVDGLEVRFDCEPDAELLADQLDADTRLHAYRIAQEALHNVARHAAASRAAVHLAVEQTPGRSVRAEPLTTRTVLRLSIADDGKGMPQQALPIDYTELLREGHLGLASMRERAERIGASLAVAPNPGGGTLVDLRIPVSARPTSLESLQTTGALEAAVQRTLPVEPATSAESEDTQRLPASQEAPVPLTPAQAGTSDERAGPRSPTPS